MFRIICLSALAVCHSMGAFAGHERGNGSDSGPAEAGSAWFISPERTVSYCVQVSDNFGANEEKLLHLIQNSILLWTDYVTKNQIAAMDKVRGFSKTYVYSSYCDASADLTFYFGVTTPEVEAAAKELDLTNPTAFAYRKTYDLSAGWGRGFVWLAPQNSVEQSFPNWSEGHVLQSIILHELGHVFGVDHVIDTIMERNIVDTMKDSQNWPEESQRYFATNIDHRNALFSNLGAVDLPGRLVDPWFQQGTVADTFAAFSGFVPAGPVTTSIKNAGLGDSRFDLKLMDARGEFTVVVDCRLPEESIGWQRNVGYPIFVRAYAQNLSSGEVEVRRVFEEHSSSVMTCKSKFHDGREIPVLATTNIGRSPIRLTYLLDGRWISLFYPEIPIMGGN